MVEAECARMRRATGHRTVGRKVGYANKALWRVLKLESLVWAHMYDDTVRMAVGNDASISLGAMCSPRIEPEIVFKMKQPIGGARDVSATLDAVEWLALGFEIIDCVCADWTFQPADFVATGGLHAALIVGDPCQIEPGLIPKLVEQLATFRVRLLQDGALVAEGSGRNSLRSPALCLAEPASAIRARSPEDGLAAGEVVSSGTLTESQTIAPGQTWTAMVHDLGVPALTVRTLAGS